MEAKKDDSWREFQNPARAVQVWDAAVAEMGLEKARKILGLSESAPRMWKLGKIVSLEPPSARKVQRLAKRTNGGAK